MKTTRRQRPGKSPEKKGPAKPAPAKYRLRLYVTGATSRSTRAIANLKTLCDKYLAGGYELEIVDIYQKPELARQVQLVAAPTLIKEFPLPLRKFIGDMSNTEHLLAGLEIVARQLDRIE